MTPRRRVLAALEHKKTDRVPILEPWIEPEMIGEFGERDLAGVYINLGLDGLMIPNAAPPKSNSWREGPDEWGRVWHRGIYSGGLIGTQDDVRRFSPPLDYANEFFDVREIAEVKRLYPEHCLLYGSHIGPFTAAFMAMGFERFFFSLSERPGLVHELLESRTEWCLAMYKKAVGLGVDLAILGDDGGHGRGPMISPPMWREFVLPHHRRIVRELTVPVIWHSDGAVESLLPFAVEAGFAGIHGLEPDAGMDLGRIKRDFGRDLVLLGNADLNVLFGSDLAPVRREVDRCFEEGAPGGGYIFSTCNSIFKGMNPEAVRELFRFARERANSSVGGRTT